MSTEEPSEIIVEVVRAQDEGGNPASRERKDPNTCPRCSSHYRDEELRAELRVCRTCGHHFIVGALERISQLADPGTFEEAASGLRSADPLAFVDLKPYPERLAAAASATGLDDAMVVGRAEIDGHRCSLATMEFQFLGGSMGSVVGEKFARAVDLALEESMPLISVASSGGARMQENVLALMQMAKTTCAVDALNEAGIPFISVLSHPTTGGVVASFAALGDVIVAEPGALMSFAGPRVVQQTTRERLPDDFGLAESNFRFGHIDMIVSRHELRGTLARLLRLFAGGEFVYAIPDPEVEESSAGVLGRVLQRVRRRPHGPVSSNGGSSS
jgi:acetyl-CoA carboxylase carboxyl transferase beta subunit